MSLILNYYKSFDFRIFLILTFMSFFQREKIKKKIKHNYYICMENAQGKKKRKEEHSN